MDSEILAKVCSVDDCEKEHVARGYCAKHYHRARKRGEFNEIRPKAKGCKGCEAEGCNRDHYSLGYCRLHYARLKRTGSLEVRQRHPAGGKCEVDECEENKLTRGLCRRHYDFLRRTGYDLREEKELLDHILAVETYGLSVMVRQNVKQKEGSLLHVPRAEKS